MKMDHISYRGGEPISWRWWAFLLKMWVSFKFHENVVWTTPSDDNEITENENNINDKAATLVQINTGETWNIQWGFCVCVLSLRLSIVILTTIGAVRTDWVIFLDLTPSRLSCHRETQVITSSRVTRGIRSCHRWMQVITSTGVSWLVLWAQSTTHKYGNDKGH